MKTVLKTEEAAMFAATIGLFSLLSFKWWMYLVLFFVPDLGMLGYLYSPAVGAFTYNLLHHKGIALVVLAIGSLNFYDYVILAGLILLGHSSFDRMLGYGLKYSDSFSNTHLGKIGNKKPSPLQKQ